MAKYRKIQFEFLNFYSRKRPSKSNISLILYINRISELFASFWGYVDYNLVNITLLRCCRSRDKIDEIVFDWMSLKLNPTLILITATREDPHKMTESSIIPLDWKLSPQVFERGTQSSDPQQTFAQCKSFEHKSPAINKKSFPFSRNINPSKSITRTLFASVFLNFIFFPL